MAQSTYHTAYIITTDYDLHVRVSAAAVQENATKPPEFDPELWAREHAWDYASQSDWIAAVMSALESGVPQWGADPGVITDQHILSYVQSAMAA